MAFCIATPVWSHFELAKKSLEAGKHTFVEKPMASNVSQCKELVELADNRGLILMTGHTFIYSTPVRRIKEIIKAGDIGKILYISSQRMNLGLFQTDINTAWDLAPHDISIILYILGNARYFRKLSGKSPYQPRYRGCDQYVVDVFQWRICHYSKQLAGPQ